MLQHLLLGQRVSLDRRRSERTLGQIELVQRLRGPGPQGHTSDVLTFGTRYSKEQPQLRTRLPQIDLERNPGMCPLKCPHKCPLHESRNNLSLRCMVANNVVNVQRNVRYLVLEIVTIV